MPYAPPTMTRKPLPSLALSAALLATLAACGGEKAPELSDPAEIVTKGIEAMGELDSLHLAVALDGSVTSDALGGGRLSLDGTSFEGDVDIEGERGHFTFELPTLLGLDGEVIVIGEDSYVKTSLGGESWFHQASGAPDDEFSVPETAKVEDFLDTEGISLEKLDDASCDDGTCYQLELTLDLAALGGLDELPADLPFDLPSELPAEIPQEFVVTLLVDKETLFLHEASTSLDAGEAGSLSVTLTLSGFNEELDIQAPPSDQVEEGNPFSF